MCSCQNGPALCLKGGSEVQPLLLPVELDKEPEEFCRESVNRTNMTPKISVNKLLLVSSYILSWFYFYKLIQFQCRNNFKLFLKALQTCLASGSEQFSSSSLNASLVFSRIQLRNCSVFLLVLINLADISSLNSSRKNFLTFLQLNSFCCSDSVQP